MKYSVESLAFKLRIRLFASGWSGAGGLAKPTDAGDRASRIRLGADERRIKTERGRLQALYHYNKAVANLEQALGMSLEEAFASSGKK